MNRREPGLSGAGCVCRMRRCSAYARCCFASSTARMQDRSVPRSARALVSDERARRGRSTRTSPGSSFSSRGSSIPRIRSSRAAGVRRAALDHGLRRRRRAPDAGHPPAHARVHRERMARPFTRRRRRLRSSVAYAVEVGGWDLEQRGDARACASTWIAAACWSSTTSTARSNGQASCTSMSRVYPDRPVVEIPESR